MPRNGYLAEDGIRLVTVEDDDQLIATAAAAYLAAKAHRLVAVHGRPLNGNKPRHPRRFLHHEMH